jgi:DNA ligase-1
MLGGRLGPTARMALFEGREALEAVGLEVGRGVRPMLAATAASVEEALAELGTCSVEWKLDGARIQVHRRGDEVVVYTRNLNDVTGRLPDVVAAAWALPVTSVVLDGETLMMDEEGRPRSFQDSMSRFGADEARSGSMGSAVLHPWFFDCLHVDGEDLLDRPLHERLARLEAIAPQWRIPGVLTDDLAAAVEVQREALSSGHEGVMVKQADSPYQAGRRGKAWRKVKPVHTLDLVVLAVEWGSGRRRGWLSNLHLGARDPDGGFVMVGKTFKGLTDALLTWQTEHFQSIKVSDDGHVVVVRPETVVEIALDGVQRSTRYAGGVALRFARVKRYREDKTPAEADTIDDVRSLLR